MSELIDEARRTARRYALLEAANAVCPECFRGVKRRELGQYWHGLGLLCKASPIHKLLEKETVDAADNHPRQ